MARLLGRSPSTVGREISRNGGYDRYWAALADEKAWKSPRFFIPPDIGARIANEISPECNRQRDEWRRDCRYHDFYKILAGNNGPNGLGPVECDRQKNDRIEQLTHDHADPGAEREGRPTQRQLLEFEETP